MKKIILLTILIILILSLTFTKLIKNKKIINKNTNLFIHITGYKKNLKYRYVKYYKKKKNISLEDTVTQVNIGLDKPFYTNTTPSRYINKKHILVNKYLYLKSDYIPKNLEVLNEEYSRTGMKLIKSAKNMFEKMYYDAKKEGYTIRIVSSYRDFNYQEKLYNKYKKLDGKKNADKYSARPGYSEHQTGLCVDIDDKKNNYELFDKSPSYNWMLNNSYKYGFILRYPKGKENITGYSYEPWHYRYVGIDIAKYIYDNNITFDEYYAKYIK